MQENPLVLYLVSDQALADSDRQVLFPDPELSLSAASGGPARDINKQSPYDREVMCFASRLSRASATELPELRKRLITAAAADGRYNGATLSFCRSLIARYVTEETVDVRLQWQRFGAHGVLEPDTLQRYAREFSRFIGFLVREHGLPDLVIADWEDHKAADAMIAPLFGLMQAPLDLAKGFGFSCVGEFIAIRHLHNGQGVNLRASLMAHVIAALRFALLLVTCAFWVINKTSLHAQPVAAVVAASKLQIPFPAVDAVSAQISKLSSDCRTLFVKDTYCSHRLGLIIKAAKLASRADRSSCSNVDPLQPGSDVLTNGLQTLSWATLGDFVAGVEQLAYDELSSVLGDFIVTPQAKRAVMDALKDGTISDAHVSDGWTSVASLRGSSTTATALAALWTSISLHLEHTFHTIDQDFEKSDNWSNFLATCDSIKFRLFALMLCAAGPPRRGSEIALTKHRRAGPGEWDGRTIFLSHGTIMFADPYNKTAKGSGVGHLAYHFFPESLCPLLVIYLVVIRELENKIAAIRFNEPAHVDLNKKAILANYRSFLFCSRGLLMNPGKLTAEFRTQTQQFLEQDFTIRLYRQFSVGLAKPVFSGMALQGGADPILAWLCGHTVKTHATKYAVPTDGFPVVDAATAAVYCGVWHACLGYTGNLAVMAAQTAGRTLASFRKLPVSSTRPDVAKVVEFSTTVRIELLM
jgi:hypothetical protein